MKTRKKTLDFLNINIPITINNKYEFKVHREKAITNKHIILIPCINPNIINSAFKGFLHRALRLYSEKYIKKEEKLLIDMFVENRQRRQLLKNLVIE